MECPLLKIEEIFITWNDNTIILKGHDAIRNNLPNKAKSFQSLTFSCHLRAIAVLRRSPEACHISASNQNPNSQIPVPNQQPNSCIAEPKPKAEQPFLSSKIVAAREEWTGGETRSQHGSRSLQSTPKDGYKPLPSGVNKHNQSSLQTSQSVQPQQQGRRPATENQRRELASYQGQSVHGSNKSPHSILLHNTEQPHKQRSPDSKHSRR